MRWHDDDYIPVQEGGLDRLDLPVDVDAGQIIDSYVGSPMYAVIPEHAPAVLFLVAMYGAFWWMRRRGSSRLDSYHRLPKVHRFLAWLLAISGVGHLALVFTHEPSLYTVLYLLGGAIGLLGHAAHLDGQRFAADVDGLTDHGLLGGRPLVGPASRRDARRGALEGQSGSPRETLPGGGPCCEVECARRPPGRRPEAPRS